MFAELRSPRDDDRSMADAAEVHDQPRTAMTYNGPRLPDVSVELGVRIDSGALESRRARSRAVLNDPIDLAGRPSLHPVEQPVKRVVVGAHRDHDTRDGVRDLSDESANS